MSSFFDFLELHDNDIIDDIVCAQLIVHRKVLLRGTAGKTTAKVIDYFSVSKIIQFYQTIIFKTVRN